MRVTKGKGLPGTTPSKPQSGSAASKKISPHIVADPSAMVTSIWAHCEGCGYRFTALRWQTVCFCCLNAGATVTPAVLHFAGVSV